MDNIGNNVPLHILVHFPVFLWNALFRNIFLFFFFILIFLYLLSGSLTCILLHFDDMGVFHSFGLLLDLKTWEKHFLMVLHWRFIDIWKDCQAHIIKVIENRVGLESGERGFTIALIQEVKELNYWENYHFEWAIDLIIKVRKISRFPLFS